MGKLPFLVYMKGWRMGSVKVALIRAVSAWLGVVGVAGNELISGS